MLWVGIDEAGYGPNLGPLVMTAVVAEGPDGRPPDLWSDLAGRVTRAGGPGDGLWVDDSKKVYAGGKGLARLEAAALAALDAAGAGRPARLSDLLRSVGAGDLAVCELTSWLAEGDDPPVPRPAAAAGVESARIGRPFAGAPWSLVAVRAVVLGPAGFNACLGPGDSKARAHFSAFARLLTELWEAAGAGGRAFIRADKHGGRHFYGDLLAEALPGASIGRAAEGPELSRYTIADELRQLELNLQPRADAADGLVALASIVSKALREYWMTAFNAFWAARIAGLRPTAGYPGDAARFRAEIEPHCRALGLDPSCWWRAK